MSGEYHKPDRVIIDDPALRNLDRGNVSDQDEWDAMTQATDPPAVFWPYRRSPTMLDVEAPHVHVYLAVHPTKGIFWAGIDRNEAHQRARDMGSLVARVPVVGDYREHGESDG